MRRNTAAPAPALMSSLPQSDAVAQVKVKQLLSEAMPRMLANNPAKLSEVNASIDRFKDRTGLDPRMFQQVALGIRFTYPSEGVTKVQTVALANGTFSAAAMVAAGRIASNGKYREEKYQDKTIYIFTLEENIKTARSIRFQNRRARRGATRHQHIGTRRSERQCAARSMPVVHASKRTQS